jgi:transglutaminase-like putative cysteine protease
MKFKIQHTTTYRYRRPVTLGPHRLLLTPHDDHNLRVLARTLDCEPAADLECTQDVFGNIVVTARFAEPASELVIATGILVEQSASQWPVFRIAPGAHRYPFRYSDHEEADLGTLLRPIHADQDGALASWAEGFILGSHTDTLSLLKDVNAGIVAAVAYRTRDEEGTQAPLDTLSLGSGSCRDLAALFIDAVRHLGFGARAVSGYLFDPDVGDDDGGSTHAWADVYLPGAGWIAFDPTHRRVGSANLIPVAVGRCNGQIMPVSGGYVGGADDFVAMDVRVQVAPV